MSRNVVTHVLWRRAWGTGLLIAMCALADPVSAQYFGRNKVRYDTPAFRVLLTDHFDVYYDPAERSKPAFTGGNRDWATSAGASVREKSSASPWSSSVWSGPFNDPGAAGCFSSA